MKNLDTFNTIIIVNVQYGACLLGNNDFHPSDIYIIVNLFY